MAVAAAAKRAPMAAASATTAPAQQQQPGIGGGGPTHHPILASHRSAALNSLLGASSSSSSSGSSSRTSSTSMSHPNQLQRHLTTSSPNSSSLVDLVSYEHHTGGQALTSKQQPLKLQYHNHRHHHQQRHISPLWRSSSSLATNFVPITRDGVHHSIRLHRKSLLAQQHRAALTSSYLSLVPTRPTSIDLHHSVGESGAKLSHRQPTITSQASKSVREALASSRQRQQAARCSASQQPRVLPASSSVTNSRLRQGALYARRHQYHNPLVESRTHHHHHHQRQQLSRGLDLSHPLSCIRSNKPEQHTTGVIEHRSRQQTISKTPSRISLNSSTSSLTLAVVKRVKPSPQAHTTSGRGSSSSRSEHQRSSPSLGGPPSIRRTRTGAGSAIVGAESKHETITATGKPVTGGRIEAAAGNRRSVSGRVSSRCSTYLSAQRRPASSSSSSSSSSNALSATRKPATRANSASASVNIAAGNGQALANGKQQQLRINLVSGNIDIIKTTTRHHHQLIEPFNTKGTCPASLSLTSTKLRPADSSSSGSKLPINIGNNSSSRAVTTTTSRPQVAASRGRKGSASAVLSEARGVLPSNQKLTKSNMISDSSSGGRQVVGNNFAGCGGAESVSNNAMKQQTMPPSPSSSSQRLEFIKSSEAQSPQITSSPSTRTPNGGKNPLGLSSSGNSINDTTTPIKTSPLMNGGNNSKPTPDMTQLDSLEHTENLPPPPPPVLSLHHQHHQHHHHHEKLKSAVVNHADNNHVTGTKCVQPNIDCLNDCDQISAIEGPSAEREIPETDIDVVVDDQSNCCDNRSESGSVDSRRTMDYQEEEEEDMKSAPTTAQPIPAPPNTANSNKRDFSATSPVGIQRSDSLESNLESAEEDHMVLGSPLVTPPPSELEVDVDEDNMIGRGSLGSTGEQKPVEMGISELVSSAVVKSPAIMRPVDIPIRIEPISDYYDLEARPFARGKFAQVKRCISKTSQQCFAAKCIKKRRRQSDIRHEILLEIEALKLSYHTNRIVKLYEVYETPTEMMLILEMANGGELQRVLEDEERIAEKLVKRMVRQILDGLIQLHDINIAHLDIKPQNLLLTEAFPDGDIKLCDFGISRRITKDCEIREICGTPDYVAPEILRYDPISLATDMWSLGVLTYVLLSGYSPFGSESKQQTFCNITQAELDFPGEIFDKISRDAIDFMTKLIIREPSDRLTSRQARAHPWLSCH